MVHPGAFTDVAQEFGGSCVLICSGQVASRGHSNAQSLNAGCLSTIRQDCTSLVFARPLCNSPCHHCMVSPPINRRLDTLNTASPERTWFKKAPIAEKILNRPAVSALEMASAQSAARSSFGDVRPDHLMQKPLGAVHIHRSQDSPGPLLQQFPAMIRDMMSCRACRGADGRGMRGVCNQQSSALGAECQRAS